MRLGSRFRDSPEPSRDEIRRARIEAARRNPFWTEVEGTVLVSASAGSSVTAKLTKDNRRWRPSATAPSLVSLCLVLAKDPQRHSVGAALKVAFTRPLTRCGRDLDSDLARSSLPRHSGSYRRREPA